MNRFRRMEIRSSFEPEVVLGSVLVPRSTRPGMRVKFRVEGFPIRLECDCLLPDSQSPENWALKAGPYTIETLSKIRDFRPAMHPDLPHNYLPRAGELLH